MNSIHDYHIEVLDGNKLKFIFDTINLPSETANEPASHGFVAYKIKPRNDIQVGEIISGNAYIYFDFNASIITNTVSTEVVETLDVSKLNSIANIKIYPNPVQGELYLSSGNGIIIDNVIIADISGKLVLEFQEHLEKVDLEVLERGVYIMKLNTNQGQFFHKLIKNQRR